MLRYAKSCGCFALRYGVITIAAIDIIFALVALGFNAADMHRRGHNQTHSNGKEMTEQQKDKARYTTANIFGLIIQVLTILIAISLIAVAGINKSKYRKIALIWIAWTVAETCFILLTTILKLAYGSNGLMGLIEMCVNLVFFLYQLLCLWFVISYYKLLGSLENADNVGYDFFADQEELSVT